MTRVAEDHRLFSKAGEEIKCNSFFIVLFFFFGFFFLFYKYICPSCRGTCMSTSVVTKKDACHCEYKYMQINCCWKILIDICLNCKLWLLEVCGKSCLTVTLRVSTIWCIIENNKDSRVSSSIYMGDDKMRTIAYIYIF